MTVKQQLAGFFVAHGQVKVRWSRIVVAVTIRQKTLPQIAAKVQVLDVFHQEFGGSISKSTLRDGVQVQWQIGAKHQVLRFCQFFVDTCLLPTPKKKQCEMMIAKLSVIKEN